MTAGAAGDKWARALRKKVRAAAALAARPPAALDAAQAAAAARLPELRAQLVQAVGETEAAAAVEEGSEAGRAAQDKADKAPPKQQVQKPRPKQLREQQQQRHDGRAQAALRRSIAAAAKADDVLGVLKRAAGGGALAACLPVDTLVYALNAAAKRSSAHGDLRASFAAAVAIATTVGAVVGGHGQDVHDARDQCTLNARQITSSLWSMATLAAAMAAAQAPGQGQLRAPLQALLRAATAEAATFDARGVATAMWAVGKLTGDAGADSSISGACSTAALQAALEARLVKAAPQFNERDVSTALWGLAKAHSRPQCRHARSAALEAALRCARELHYMPQELSMTAWATASLACDWTTVFAGDGGEGAGVANATAGALEEAMRACAPRMNPQALATCLWAVARMRCGGARAIEGGALEHGGVDVGDTSSSLPASASAAAHALLEHAAERARGGAFANVRTLAMGAWGAAKLGVGAEALLRAAIMCQHARDTVHGGALRGLSAADAADMAWAMSVRADALEWTDAPWVLALIDAARGTVVAAAPTSRSSGGSGGADWQALGRFEYACWAVHMRMTALSDGADEASRARVLASVSALRDAMASCACVALEAAQAGASDGDDSALAALEALAARERGGWGTLVETGEDLGGESDGGVLVAGRYADAAETAATEAGARVTRWRPYAEGAEGATDWPPPPSSSALYSVVVLRLPAARDAAAMALRAVADVTSPGATLWACGATAEGAGPMLTAASEGELGALWKARGGMVKVNAGMGLAAAFKRRKSKKARLADGDLGAAAYKETIAMALPRCGHEEERAVAGWVTLPGLFAGGRADDMTRFLVRNLPCSLPSHDEARVLDFGCGSGAVAAALCEATRGDSEGGDGAKVYALDACAAAASACALNVPQATVLVSDGWKGVEGGSSGAALSPGSLDWVVSNPPVHNGAHTDFSVARELVCGAARYLRAGGKLFAVTQCYVPLGLMVCEWTGGVGTGRPFDFCKIRASDGRFSVWELTAGDTG